MQFAQWQLWLRRLDSDRLVHSLKTAIALLFGLLISYLLSYRYKEDGSLLLS